MVFNNQSTIATGQIVNWDWNFDDGNTGTVENPNHLYVSDGDYNVGLTVTSDSGCVNSTVDLVSVFPNPTAEFDFTNACDNEDVLFESTALPGIGTISDYYWRSEEHTSELQSRPHLVCRLLLEKKKQEI